MKCRHCELTLTHRFVDLGFAPPSNAYLRPEDLGSPETHFPLRVNVCHECWLVQTEDYARAEELFNADYAYFSSTSSSWLDHAARFAHMVIERLQLGFESLVIEVASNDGYLLKNFKAAGIPCLGIEPTASTAAAAEALGLSVRREFFSESLGRQLAAEGRRADLIVGNNVYAHVPDINDFTRGLAAALKPEGTVTLEFPHVMPLIERTQFDTIYHEHFSYLSLTTVTRIFAMAGLRIWDVEELPTHGGSLRIFGCHAAAAIATTNRVDALLTRECEFGLTRPETYAAFQARADRLKDDLLAFLIEQKRIGQQVAAYGAAAKGNTLLNYAGVRSDLLPYVCDAAVSKQGKFMPGSHIPIRSPEELRKNPPDALIVLPWNIVEEVQNQLADLAQRGTRFVTAIPELSFL
ncbi:class I SAM-dependent methyltransferase [Mycobacterium intracellulare]|uniref:class I SAM-dependent methyltransferase n=1 Tax=Mycobacterium intracellulare TaxID=1767 RepID=UPI0005B3EAB3|nr:class I SAM-dependent methyltransferase [Mycobacterium intracellulare]AOS92631.1 SAM-dependent methyltransferase [Mycobacterium intracellulare subsp. chimaera]ARV82925.1 SAM-dependent methyltransferase [Mycobacterium intracellulare subsp. chimaera]ASL10120.1 methyltransferase [Mycobacterium intracellulare subsp. chimaera]ASL22021.1 methyltransferase [Mycobacterium intracellulare subsp. chimaera]KPN47107.1 SAM-dependent methyltransferase [Mycobacterium intracellulare subsp. chimaera]